MKSKHISIIMWWFNFSRKQTLLKEIKERRTVIFTILEDLNRNHLMTQQISDFYEKELTELSKLSHNVHK